MAGVTTDVQVAPPCWVCERPIDTFAYRVRAWTRRTRPAWNGWALICPDCYDLPRQNDERHEWSDGRELLGVSPTACEHCGVRVALKPDNRRERHTCSEACRVAVHRRLERERQERNGEWKWTCEGCGSVIDGSRADRKYCSSACRQRAYRRRAAAAPTP